MIKNLTLGEVIFGSVFDSEKGWIEYQHILTNEQKEKLLEIFGTGCQNKTKMRLTRCFDDNCKRVNSSPILNRIHLIYAGRKEVSYTAVQDDTREISQARKLLIANY